MKKTIYLLLAALLLVGCCPCKNLVSTTIEQDNTDTKVTKETIFVTDTLFVEIPEQKAERTTPDSTSHLENDYAVSDASINPDGTLHHTLETKPQKKPVEFQKPVERNDSIVYRYKYKDREVIKEKELSRWDAFKVDYGGYALTSLLLIMGYAAFRLYRKFTITKRG
ncbi:MAG: hypothetical protein IJ064_05400 [Bacteroidaceae bacterium]|nr:hypothetical protein [Bacteroidaceae bacterium]